MKWHDLNLPASARPVRGPQSTISIGLGCQAIQIVFRHGSRALDRGTELGRGSVPGPAALPGGGTESHGAERDLRLRRRHKKNAGFAAELPCGLMIPDFESPKILKKKMCLENRPKFFHMGLAWNHDLLEKSALNHGRHD